MNKSVCFTNHMTMCKFVHGNWILSVKVSFMAHVQAMVEANLIQFFL